MYDLKISEEVGQEILVDILTDQYESLQRVMKEYGEDINDRPTLEAIEEVVRYNLTIQEYKKWKKRVRK